MRTKRAALVLYEFCALIWQLLPVGHPLNLEGKIPATASTTSTVFNISLKCVVDLERELGLSCS